MTTSFSASVFILNWFNLTISLLVSLLLVSVQVCFLVAELWGLFLRVYFKVQKRYHSTSRTSVNEIYSHYSINSAASSQPCRPAKPHLDLDRPAEVGHVHIEGDVVVKLEVELFAGETVTVLVDVGPRDDGHLLAGDGARCEGHTGYTVALLYVHTQRPRDTNTTSCPSARLPSVWRCLWTEAGEWAAFKMPRRVSSRGGELTLRVKAFSWHLAVIHSEPVNFSRRWRGLISGSFGALSAVLC